MVWAIGQRKLPAAVAALHYLGLNTSHVEARNFRRLAATYFSFGALSEHPLSVDCSNSMLCTMDVRDVDDSSQPLPPTDTWKMLWDAADSAEGLGISFESSLVDNLLRITGNDSVEQGSLIICDRCKKVSLFTLCD